MSVEELWENFWKEITKIRPDFVLPDLRAWQRAAYVITSQTDFTRSSTRDGSFIKGVSQFTFIRGSKGEEGNARG